MAGIYSYKILSQFAARIERCMSVSRAAEV